MEATTLSPTDQHRTIWRTEENTRQHAGTKQPAITRISPRVWALQLHYRRLGVWGNDHRTHLIDQLTWELNNQPTGAHYGYILPRRFFRMGLLCNPRLCLKGITSVQWMGIGQGASFVGPWATHHPPTVQQPIEHHANWWLDWTFQPPHHTKVRDIIIPLIDGNHSASGQTWIVLYENTPEYNALSNIIPQAHWIARIPPNSISMRARQTILQDDWPPWAFLTHHNRRAIRIGVFLHQSGAGETAAPPPMNTISATTIRRQWALTAPTWGDKNWVLPPTDTEDERNQVPPTHHAWYNLWWHPSINVNREISGPTPPDPWLDQSRQWLLHHHRALYAHPSGWKCFPTCHPTTLQWFHDICWIPQKASATHKVFFRLLWTTIRRHWNRSCTLNIEQINAMNNDDDLSQANQLIMTNKRKHDMAEPRIARSIRCKLDQNVQQTTLWHHFHQEPRPPPEPDPRLI